MPDPGPIERLAEMLRGSGAVPDLTPMRAAPSAVFDVQYRVIIVSLAFELHASVDRNSPGRPRLRASLLKLVQFVAIRPWLVQVVREWSEQRRSAERWLDAEEGLRRGFLGDSTHDAVMRFLVAGDVRRRAGDHVVGGTRAEMLGMLSATAREHRLFASEIQALIDMQAISVTNDMLKGW